MKMPSSISIIISLLLVLLFMVLYSCGNNDEPVDPNKDPEYEITRVKDGNGKVFLCNGELVDANLKFDQALMTEALTSTVWKRDYVFIYDNSHVSDTFDLGVHSSKLPIFINPDSTFGYQDNTKLRFLIDGKRLISLTDHVSSNPKTDLVFNLIAVDYDEHLKRIVLDQEAKYIIKVPEGYNSTTTIRMVWVPAE